MRFSIRDLFWATLVVAMSLGWWISLQGTDAKRLAAVQQAHRLWDTLNAAKELDDWNSKTFPYWLGLEEYKEEYKPGYASVPLVHWSILDEPLVQP